MNSAEYILEVGGDFGKFRLKIKKCVLKKRFNPLHFCFPLNRPGMLPLDNEYDKNRKISRERKITQVMAITILTLRRFYTCGNAIPSFPVPLQTGYCQRMYDYNRLPPVFIIWVRVWAKKSSKLLIYLKIETLFVFNS